MQNDETYKIYRLFLRQMPTSTLASFRNKKLFNNFWNFQNSNKFQSASMNFPSLPFFSFRYRLMLEFQGWLRLNFIKYCKTTRKAQKRYTLRLYHIFLWQQRISLFQKFCNLTQNLHGIYLFQHSLLTFRKTNNNSKFLLVQLFLIRIIYKSICI